MKRKFDSETLNDAMIIFVVILLIYFFSMVIYPFYVGGWKKLHAVWLAWQTFNAGMIALAAALIAAWISISNSRRQEQIEFESAKALLAESLSSLTYFLNGTRALMIEAQEKLQTQEKYKQYLINEIPELEPDYRTIFSKCISYGPKELGRILIKILECLQIHRSRVRALKESDFHPDSKMMVMEINIISEIAYQCELRALINKLFPFARRQEAELSEVLSKDEVIEALMNTSLDGHLEDKVRAYIERKFNRQAEQKKA